MITELYEPKADEVIGRCADLESAMANLRMVFPPMTTVEIAHLWALETKRREAAARLHERLLDKQPDIDTPLVERPDYVLAKLQELVTLVRTYDVAFRIVMNAIDAVAMRLKSGDIDGAATVVANVQRLVRERPVVH